MPQYSPEEVQRRFDAWRRLPATDPKHIPARNAAWHAYCDARDGLPEGSSATRYRDLVVVPEPTQLDMFRRRTV